MITVNDSLARTFRALRDTCGYIENGGGNTVTIYQDDATRTWTVKVGKSSYYGDSLEEAIHKAHAVHHELIDPKE